MQRATTAAAPALSRRRSAVVLLVASFLAAPLQVSARAPPTTGSAPPAKGGAAEAGADAIAPTSSPPSGEGPRTSAQRSGQGTPASATEQPSGANPEGPRPAAPSPASMGLSRSSDGQFVYEDRGGRFTATVRTDGSVLFADAWRRTSAANPDAGKCCGIARPGLLNPLAGISMGGPTEWIMRAHGIDPSRSAKTDFLESTLELRINLAIAWTVDRINERLEAIDFEMLEIWSDGTSPATERRDLMFHRWDECDENFKVIGATDVQEARSEIDRYRAQAAEVARKKIEKFIRRHLPRGSNQAYGKAELGRLNSQRMSVQTFSPYTSASR